MKIKNLLLSFILIFSINSFGQINIGSNENPTKRSGAGELKPQDFKKLKRTTLVLFYGKTHEKHLEKYKEALKSWNFSTIIMDNIANLATYDKKRNHAFATLKVESVFTVQPNLGTKTETSCKVYLHFWYKKGKKVSTFARLDLFTKYEDIAALLKLPKEEDKINYMYEKGKAYNWTPGFSSFYFKQMSQMLNDGQTINSREEIENEEALKELSNNVLFYPEYTLLEMDATSKTISEQTEEELFSKYSYEHELMLPIDFNNLLTENSDGIDYVLLYVQTGQDKFFSICTTKGEILFSRYEVNSVNMNKKNLKRIAKLVE